MIGRYGMANIVHNRYVDLPTKSYYYYLIPTGQSILCMVGTCPETEAESGNDSRNSRM